MKLLRASLKTLPLIASPKESFGQPLPLLQKRRVQGVFRDAPKVTNIPFGNGYNTKVKHVAEGHLQCQIWIKWI